MSRFIYTIPARKHLIFIIKVQGQYQSYCNIYQKVALWTGHRYGITVTFSGKHLFIKDNCTHQDDGSAGIGQY